MSTLIHQRVEFANIGKHSYGPANLTVPLSRFLPVLCLFILVSNGAYAGKKQILSPEDALQAARLCLNSKKIDVAQYDLGRPEAIQKLQAKVKTRWRISWKPANFTGKGGQLVVILNHDGSCQQGFGE